MTRYLLDTNDLSGLVRNPQGVVAQHIHRVGETQVCTSIVVAAEVRYGAAKKNSPRLLAQVEAVLGALDVLPFDPPAPIPFTGVCVQSSSRAGNPSERMIF